MSELERMTVTELRRKYAEVFGEEMRSYHKAYLVRRIAWRVQANAEGDIAERARRLRERALAIADDADLRMRAPGPARPPGPARLAAQAPATATASLPVSADSRLPMPGALLTREYRGRPRSRTARGDSSARRRSSQARRPGEGDQCTGAR